MASTFALVATKFRFGREICEPLALKRRVASAQTASILVRGKKKELHEALVS